MTDHLTAYKGGQAWGLPTPSPTGLTGRTGGCEQHGPEPRERGLMLRLIISKHFLPKAEVQT